VHPTTTAELKELLDRLLKYGDGVSMLIMTVATTSDGMICTLDDGALTLNYLSGGWLSRANRAFKRFGVAHDRKVISVKWGDNTFLQMRLGKDPMDAAELIDRCFQDVWGHSQPFKLDLRGYGWKSVNEPEPQGSV
jgi:hypothetical protein